MASVEVLGFIQEVDLNTDWVKRLPTLFQGLGSFGTRVKIALREGSSAFCQLAPRRVAAARRQPLQKELRRMERLGVISRVEGPTD